MGIHVTRHVVPLRNFFSSTDVNYAEDDNVNSTMIDLRDFRAQSIQIIAADSYDGTISFYASADDEAPDLDSASAAGNAYAGVQIKKRLTDTPLTNGNQFVFTGSEDGTYLLSPNTDEIKWIGCKITGRSAGSVVIQISMVDNA